MKAPRVEESELHAVEDQLERAFRGQGEGSLRVIGYGEISCVVALDGAHGPLALKRLPPFSDRARFEAYRACFESYLATLAAHGVEPVPSVLVGVDRGARVAAFVAQPRLDPAALLPAYLRAGDEARAREAFDAIATRVRSTVGPALGLDGQLSNWVWHEGAPRYLDVTTPLMRDASGRERLDTELFMISLPWALRPLVRRLLLGQILDKYYEPRGVLLDLLGNLLKERLAHLLPALLPRAATHASPPITDAEVRAYYADDARMWALLQRLRRVDRGWQLRVRRRPYPFLLPARIER